MAAALVASALPAPALGAEGAPTGGGAGAPNSPPTAGGGGSYGTPVPPTDDRRRGGSKHRKRSRHPRRGALLTEFSLVRSNLFLYGRAARVRFRITARRPVLMRLQVLRPADRSVVATLDLGKQTPGAHELRYTGIEDGVLPEGRYLLQVAGRRLRRAPRASSTADLLFRHHRFPLVGPFDWGGDGARFGAPRNGHRHQGQDLAAAEGTPVVAPRGGVIETVHYQAEGAGHYVVLDGEAEDRDYVFMHLRDGSITVKAGERVRTGQRIGEVGSTGDSTGPHLHFEVWVGSWNAGGEPIDPLPLLEHWAAST